MEENDNNEMKNEIQNESPKPEKKQRKKMDVFSKALIGIGSVIGVVALGSLGSMQYKLQDIPKSQGLYGVTPVGRNDIFEKYSIYGSISQSELYVLLSELRVHNASKELTSKYGEITYIGSGENVPKSLSERPSNSYRYKVSFTYYDSDSPYAGCIKTITVSENK